MFGSFKKPPARPIFRADQLVPRIKHRNFIKTMQDAGVPPEQTPVTTALCGELLVTYAFDMGDEFVMANPKFMKQAGVSEAELASLALGNLTKVLPQIKFFGKDGCAAAQVGNRLEATLLLVDSVWTGMAHFGGEILATVPARDCILICDSADPLAVRTLRESTPEFYYGQDNNHRLSQQIMVRRGQAWSLFDKN